MIGTQLTNKLTRRGRHIFTQFGLSIYVAGWYTAAKHEKGPSGSPHPAANIPAIHGTVNNTGEKSRGNLTLAFRTIFNRGKNRLTGSYDIAWCPGPK
jgi:hypothetical protein